MTIKTYVRHNRYFAFGEDLNKVNGHGIQKRILRYKGLIIPIYAYVHGGVALSESPFNCRFDSGQCGFIAISKSTITKQFKGITEKAIEYAHLMIQDYDDYVNNREEDYDNA